MPTRDGFDNAQALFDEAVAMYETAKAEFEALQERLRRRFQQNTDYEALEVAKWNLFRTRARLMRVFRERDKRGRPQ